MVKFLMKASLSAEGVKGLLKEGGESRKREVSRMAAEHGGKIEAFYFSFGDDDVFVIGELPDTTTLASIALTISSSGLVRVSTTILLDPADIDKAVKTTVNYRAPGM